MGMDGMPFLFRFIALNFEKRTLFMERDWQGAIYQLGSSPARSTRQVGEPVKRRTCLSPLVRCADRKVRTLARANHRSITVIK